MKTAKTFRLSAQAVERLQYLNAQTGANETAIVELALALFEHDIAQGTRRGGGLPGRAEASPPESDAAIDALAWEMGALPDVIQKQVAQGVQKARKRRNRRR